MKSVNEKKENFICNKNNNCGCAGEAIKVENISNFADYLIENASYAFEHQDRELLERVLKDYNKNK